MPTLENCLKTQFVKLKAFRSGGGLRVLVLQHEEVQNKITTLGYAEAPTFDDALRHLEEDVEVGHRPYEEVYGKLYPHYLTGTTEASLVTIWTWFHYKLFRWSR